jgi:hypothetical protein
MLSYFVAFLVLLSCSEEPSPLDSPGPEGYPRDEYWIQVELVSIPQQIAADDSLRVVFQGFLGPTGCHRFGRFESTTESLTVRVRAIGELVHGQPCHGAYVYFEGQAFTKAPPHTNPLHIVIDQPDSTTLEGVVQVLGGSR